MRATLLFLVLLTVTCAGYLEAIAANQPPEVTILRPPYPSHGKTTLVTIDDLMLIKVAARDPDGTVARVQLFSDSTLIAEWVNPPYATVWQPPFKDFPGMCYPNWTLTAVAIDDLGAEAISVPVLVQGACTAPAGAGAAVEIISPTDGTMFSAPAAFQVIAEVQLSNPYANVNPFEFRVGTNLVGSVNSDMVRVAPYTFAITNLAEGDYRISVTHWNYPVSRTTPPVNIRVVKLGVQLPSLTADGHFQFGVVTSFPGRRTTIEASPNLLDWVSVSTNQPSSNTFTFTDPAPASDCRRFYRVLVPPEP